MSPKKIELLKQLQHLEHKWSAELMTNGCCTVDMLKIETDIKSTRNSIKYQDVQENLVLNRAS
jgi:hypothetical protein